MAARKPWPKAARKEAIGITQGAILIEQIVKHMQANGTKRHYCQGLLEIVLEMRLQTQTLYQMKGGSIWPWWCVRAMKELLIQLPVVQQNLEQLMTPGARVEERLRQSLISIRKIRLALLEVPPPAPEPGMFVLDLNNMVATQRWMKLIDARRKK